MPFTASRHFTERSDHGVDKGGRVSSKPPPDSVRVTSYIWQKQQQGKYPPPPGFLRGYATSRRYDLMRLIASNSSFLYCSNNIRSTISQLILHNKSVLESKIIN